jgi:hypothetical protein
MQQPWPKRPITAIRICSSYFFAVSKPDFETTFYINEIGLTATTKLKRRQPAVVAGDPVYHNDIADIAAAELLDREGQPIVIPARLWRHAHPLAWVAEGPLLRLFAVRAG